MEEQSEFHVVRDTSKLIKKKTSLFLLYNPWTSKWLRP